jgi:hypothetical protein
MAPGETVLRELSLDTVYALGDSPQNVDVLLRDCRRSRPVCAGGADRTPKTGSPENSATDLTARFWPILLKNSFLGSKGIFG